MDPNSEVHAAQQQFRETLIGSGLRYAERLRALREAGLDYPVAVAKGGGLALIFVKGDRAKGYGPHLRFGPVDSKNIAKSNEAEVERWNRASPAHEVELMPIQRMLEREGMRIFTLLLELQRSVERTEG